MGIGAILLGIGGVVGAVFVSAGGRVLGEDIKELTPRLTQRIVEFSVQRLPQKYQERAAAEWVAELLVDTPGIISKWCFALTCLGAAEKENFQALIQAILTPLNVESKLLKDQYQEWIQINDDGSKHSEEWNSEFGEIVEPIGKILETKTKCWVLVCIRIAYLQDDFLTGVPKKWRLGVFYYLTEWSSSCALRSAILSYLEQKYNKKPSRRVREALYGREM